MRKFLLASLLFLAAARPAASADDGLLDDAGQLLIVGFRGTDAREAAPALRAVEELRLGGVVLFDRDMPSGGKMHRNVVDQEQLRALIEALKAASRTHLFVAVDVEGGQVNRLSPSRGFLTLPSAAELGEKNDPALTRATADAASAQLNALGFNMNFAPVVDVNVNPHNPVIGSLGRSFSSDPEAVTRHASIFAESLARHGVVSVIKHFPGHGSSVGDSHHGLVDVTATYRREELVPFGRLIKGGFQGAVMTAHILDRNVDRELPATLSHRFIHGILRDELGFEGVVISDDIEMEAIAALYGAEEAAVLAIAAGCDVVLAARNGKTYDETLPYRLRDAIVRAVEDGRLSRDRVAQAAARVARLKQAL